MVFIGMDVGGTTARLRMCTQNGQPCFEGEGRGGTITGVGKAELMERFWQLMQRGFRETGCGPADVQKLVLGASGVDTPKIQEEYETLLMGLGFRRSRLMVVNDGELLLKMFDGPGIVLISGTGSIALGTDGEHDEVLRCGGWEHLLSDRGSGTDLGMHLLRAYVEAKDGMLDAPTLVHATERALGFTCAQDAVDYAAGHIMEKADIGALAHILEYARENGDTGAEAMMKECAGSLVQLVVACARKIGRPEGTVPVLLWGSVLLKNSFIQAAVRDGIARAMPGTRVLIPDFTALDAAVCLAMGRKKLCI